MHFQTLIGLVAQPLIAPQPVSVLSLGVIAFRGVLRSNPLLPVLVPRPSIVLWPPAAAELTWLSFLLHDLGLQLPKAPILLCDNLSALHMTVNLVFHGRTKHIEIDYHFVHEHVALGALETRFVPSNRQLADIFTKPLPKMSFADLRVKLGLWPDPQPNLRGSDNAPVSPAPTTNMNNSHHFDKERDNSRWCDKEGQQPP
jgi:hypothetical protein